MFTIPVERQHSPAMLNRRVSRRKPLRLSKELLRQGQPTIVYRQNSPVLCYDWVLLIHTATCFIEPCL